MIKHFSAYLILGLIAFSFSVFAQSISVITEVSTDDINAARNHRNRSSNDTSAIRPTSDAYSFRVDFNEDSYKLSSGTIEPLISNTYYGPTKAPFSAHFPSIDISGNGNSCHSIGHFYVHEYSVDTDDNILFAAIDFEQSCKGATSPSVRGSIRYNSSIPSYCTHGNCEQVRELLALHQDPGHVPTPIDFSLITESPDYHVISLGDHRDFNNDLGDAITVGYNPNTISFGIRSFDLGYSQYRFSGGKHQSLEPEKYYGPVETRSFYDDQPGMFINGDGDMCMEVWGQFYVHEYITDERGYLLHAAIDFEKKCQGKDSPSLWGSLRYDSTIPSYCQPGDCSQVKQLLDTASGNSDTNNTHSHDNDNSNGSNSNDDNNDNTHTHNNNPDTHGYNNDNNTLSDTGSTSTDTIQETDTNTSTTEQDTTVHTTHNDTMRETLRTALNNILAKKSDEEKIKFIIQIINVIDLILPQASEKTRPLLEMLQSLAREMI